MIVGEETCEEETVVFGTTRCSVGASAILTLHEQYKCIIERVCTMSPSHELITASASHIACRVDGQVESRAYLSRCTV